MTKLFLPALLLLTACTHPVGKFKESPVKTGYVTAVYWDENNRKRQDLLKIYIHDTLSFVLIDSNTMRRKWHRDSLYYCVVVDSITDPKKKTPVWTYLHPSRIIDKSGYMPDSIINNNQVDTTGGRK